MLPAVVVVVVVLLLPVVLELMALDGNDERSERLPLSLPGGGRTNPRTGLCTRRSSRSRAATHDLMVVRSSFACPPREFNHTKEEAEDDSKIFDKFAKKKNF